MLGYASENSSTWFRPSAATRLNARVRWEEAEWRPFRPEEAARRFAGLDVPWAVAAGWAIDLFVGRERREHEDLEVAIPADAVDAVRARLPELDFWVPVGGGTLVPLDEADLDDTHQTWALDTAAQEWRIDLFREPSADGRWVCRRDESIRLAYDELIERTAEGIPYVRPEVVLLFKAKEARPKDETDLAAALPLLDASRKRLLAEWLELVHPGHFWLDDLRRV